MDLLSVRDPENITFKNMTVTNSSGNRSGIRLTNAKVELFDVALKGCDYAGLYIPRSASATTLVATRCEFSNSRYGALLDGSLTSATFNNCVFHDNSQNGIHGYNTTIHLHGEATAIHSNGAYGIYTSNSGKVLIYLPSHHNTSYNNKYGDRHTRAGGTITNVEDSQLGEGMNVCVFVPSVDIRSI